MSKKTKETKPNVGEMVKTWVYRHRFGLGLTVCWLILLVAVLEFYQARQLSLVADEKLAQAEEMRAGATGVLNAFQMTGDVMLWVDEDGEETYFYCADLTLSPEHDPDTNGYWSPGGVHDGIVTIPPYNASEPDRKWFFKGSSSPYSGGYGQRIETYERVVLDDQVYALERTYYEINVNNSSRLIAPSLEDYLADEVNTRIAYCANSIPLPSTAYAEARTVRADEVEIVNKKDKTCNCCADCDCETCRCG